MRCMTREFRAETASGELETMSTEQSTMETLRIAVDLSHALGFLLSKGIASLLANQPGLLWVCHSPLVVLVGLESSS